MSASQKPLANVTKIFKRTEIDEAGKFVVKYEIRFETRSGIESNVMVPKEGYTKAKGLKAVNEAAQELEDTLGTSGSI